MILLDFHNKIVEDTFLERFATEDGKHEALEAIIADFDGVTFHLFTNPDAKNIVNVSMSMKCYSELQ
jgi:actin related protein 2/3 complex subunit 2